MLIEIRSNLAVIFLLCCSETRICLSASNKTRIQRKVEVFKKKTEIISKTKVEAIALSSNKIIKIKNHEFFISLFESYVLSYIEI